MKKRTSSLFHFLQLHLNTPFNFSKLLELLSKERLMFGIMPKFVALNHLMFLLLLLYIQLSFYLILKKTNKTLNLI